MLKFLISGPVYNRQIYNCVQLSSRFCENIQQFFFLLKSHPQAPYGTTPMHRRRTIWRLWHRRHTIWRLCHFFFFFIFSAGFCIFSRYLPTIYYLLYYLLLFSSFACMKPPADAPLSRAINSTPLPCHPFVPASERKSRREKREEKREERREKKREKRRKKRKRSSAELLSRYVFYCELIMCSQD